MKYEEYLQSPEWQNKREWALKWAGDACQVCNSIYNLHVHHRTYDNLGAELPGDLTVLCKNCHTLFHQNDKDEIEAIVAAADSLLAGDEMADVVRRNLHVSLHWEGGRASIGQCFCRECIQEIEVRNHG